MIYEVLKRLYLAGTVTDKGLVSAVTRGWITAKQSDEITQTGVEAV